MTQDGLLSLVALVIAALGFLPAARRLHLRATLRRGVAITVPALFAVFYFEFYAAAQLPCPSLLGAACEYIAMGKDSPFGPRDAAFAIVIGWALAMWAFYQGEAIGPASLPALKPIVAELLQKREHTTLVDLLEPNLSLIESAAARTLTLQRWHDWWAARRAPPPLQLIIKLSGANGVDEKRFSLVGICSWGRRVTGLPSLLIPAGRDSEAPARWIRARLLTDAPLRKHLVEERPSFGARLMTGPDYQAGDFADLFLADLAANTDSSLYREVERSGGANHQSLHHFDDSFPLLGALLNDATVADRMSAWRPIAEHFISRIRPGNDPAYVASLNRRGDLLWDERGRHHDTAFTTITFFDLMVTAATLQGVQSHMWLMYTDHFTEALLAVHDETGPDIDPFAEWPTRGAEILYRIIAALTDWLDLYQRLPTNSFHRQVQKLSLDDGEARIPKSALISLVRVTQKILLAPGLNDHFKDYIFEIVMRRASRLPDTGEDSYFRTLLVLGLAGGSMGGRRDEFVTQAWRSFRTADPVLQMAVPDLKAALQAAQPAPRTDLVVAVASPRRPRAPKSLWEKLKDWMEARRG